MSEARTDRITERKLNSMKKLLLDTGKRNRMIHYRETRRSTLRLLTPSCGELFNRLVLKEESLTFRYPIDANYDLRAYTFLELMKTLGQEIPVQIGDIGTAAPTPGDQRATLRNLRARSRLAQEEQGTNILYLSFGFLRWREKNTPASPVLISPLIMVPAALTQRSLNAPFLLSRYEDDVVVNPTLAYRFEHDFNLALPDFEAGGEKTPEDFFREMEVLADERGWQVDRDVSLGLVSFLKINMYHDLENKHDRLMRSPVIRALCGDPEALPLPEEAGRPFEPDRISPADRFQVIDADSSQQKAIQLSKIGASFVMQGPPGTGKSQTITNIIAEALADGKKVLFVSEKAAALEVVLRRLNEAHIGDFCLSLHDYRANKREVLQRIGRNLRLNRISVKSAAMNDLVRLAGVRGELNDYARELHELIQPLNMSLYGAFGELAQFTEPVDFLCEIEGPEKVSEKDFQIMTYRVERYVRAFREMGSGYADNPWRGAALRNTGAMYFAELKRRTEKLAELAGALADLAEAPLGPDRLSEATLTGVREEMERLALISGIPPHSRRLYALKQPERKALLQAAKQARLVRSLYQEAREECLKGFDGSVSEAPAEGWLRVFEENLRVIQSREGWAYLSAEETAEQLESIRGRAERLDGALERVLRGTKALRSALGLSAREEDIPFSDAERLEERLGAILGVSSPLIPAWLLPEKAGNRAREAEGLLEEAKEKARQLKGIISRLNGEWHSGLLETDVDGLLYRFKNVYSRFLGHWAPQYRQDLDAVMAHAKDKRIRYMDGQLIQALSGAKEAREVLAWFDRHEKVLQGAFGRYYRGLKTDWTEIEAGLAQAKRIREAAEDWEETDRKALSRTPGENGPAETDRGGPAEEDPEGGRKVLRALCDRTGLEELRETVRGIQDRLSEADAACVAREGKAFFPAEGLNDRSMRELRRGVDAVLRAARNLSHQVMACNIYAAFDMSPAEAYGKTKALAECARRREELEELLAENGELNRLFGESGDWSGAIAALEFANALAADPAYKGKFSEAFLRYFFERPGAREEVRERLERLREAYPAAEGVIREFSALFREGEEMFRQPLRSVSLRYQRCMDRAEQLDLWLNYQDERAECIASGLGDFVRGMEERGGKVRDPEGCFRYSFFRQWILAVTETKPAVARFKRAAQEERVELFRRLDTAQFATARQRIRAKIISTYPDPDASAAAGDEMSILLREMNKRSKIMPLRKLFRTIPNLLLRLMPCLMMSPLSVSWFLEADSYHFDMVIFDEASQIFPQDALGSIMRAGQVIIAGDTCQLPPTNFFTAATGSRDGEYDEDEEEEPEEEIADSILEEADRVMRSSTLLWHYRSRNEQLIAFSNQEIYGNRLITFPGCRDHMKDTGVEFVYVRDGLYEGRPRNCNEREAERCVALVEEHIRQYPERSLGIIAFSEKQQQAILDKMQDFREAHPEHEPFFAEDRAEPFFVKNLENVQGDERDTIFFSVGYGYTREQREKQRPMSLRFGPLGRLGGERRLNVAITRARIHIKLVASFLPGDINTEKTDSQGIRLLRDYIRFARMGTDALHASGEEAERDLLCGVVKDFLTENGYQVRERLGCSGYKIDLAVVHPRNPDCCLACIECDGEAYARARTARERERLRGEVLKRMGWQIFRLWSAEWMKNPEAEGRRLLEFLEKAAEEPFDYQGRGGDSAGEPPFGDLVEEIRKEESTEGNRYGFIPYVKAELSRTPPGVPGGSATLRDHIRYAVSVEQPISMELLCQRMVPVLEAGKVTTRVTGQVEAAVFSLGDQLHREGSFLTLKGFGIPAVRVPPEGEAQRPIQQIAPRELMEAMRRVADRSFGLSREDLIMETTRALGYARRGTRIQAVMENILNGLIRGNIIRMADDKVHAVEDTIDG